MRLIDADKIQKELDSMIVEGETFTTAVEFAKLTIKDAPTVDAEPVKRGEWRWDPEKVVLQCSNCGCEMSVYGEDVDTALDFMENAKYCIECGARMEGSRA